MDSLRSDEEEEQDGPLGEDSAWGFRSQLDSRLDAFENCWKSGVEPNIREHAVELPSPWKGMLIRELVELDLFYRQRRGESPEVEEYQRAFPEYGLMLRELVFRERSAKVVAQLPTPGMHVGPYCIEEELGAGGMGVVYRAREHGGHGLVALKVSRFDPDANWKLAARFQRESELLGRFNHPHIVRLRGAGLHGRWQFVATELLPGPTLQQKLYTAGPLPVRQAVPLALQLLSAVEALHRRHVVHRDIRPANLVFDAAGGLKLIDFGLARDLVGSLGLSSDGGLFGTPGYLSPEAASGFRGVSGPDSDTFACAGVLYRMLTGRRLNLVEATREQSHSLTPGESTAWHQISCPEEIRSILKRALSADPIERFASAELLADELWRYQRADRVDSHNYTWWDAGWRLARRVTRNWI